MVDTPRVVLGDRLNDGNMGFHVARAGFNALLDDTQDISKFSMSTDWPYVMRVINSATIAVETWLPLVTVDYWPVMIWRQWNSSNNIGRWVDSTYFSNSQYSNQGTMYYPSYRMNGSVREFRVTWSTMPSVPSTGSFIILETNLAIG